MGFEETHEMLWIVESETLAYRCDGQIFVVKHLFGVGEKAIGDYILGGTTGLHAHQIAEISARQATLIGKIGYRWQTITKCFCADVIIEKYYKLLYNLMVNLRESYERAVVESETVIQQQRDVGNNEFAGMFVDGAVKFLLYHS